MKEKRELILTSTLFAVCFFVLASCLSSPGVKTDELDGTKWECRYGSTIETYYFVRGGYEWEDISTTHSLSDHKEGTYSIKEDEILLVRKGAFGSDIELRAAFSPDRKSFSYADRTFVYAGPSSAFYRPE
jgi:hypothetical protein